jgi:hypothetical protein
MSRRDYLARLLIGVRLTTAAPSKRKASSRRDVVTESNVLSRRQGLPTDFLRSRPLVRPGGSFENSMSHHPDCFPIPLISSCLNDSVANLSIASFIPLESTFPPQVLDLTFLTLTPIKRLSAYDTLKRSSLPISLVSEHSDRTKPSLYRTVPRNEKNSAPLQIGTFHPTRKPCSGPFQTLTSATNHP